MGNCIAHAVQCSMGRKLAHPTAFWSGLVDDVRIYNQAVSP